MNIKHSSDRLRKFMNIYIVLAIAILTTCLIIIVNVKNNYSKANLFSTLINYNDNWYNKDNSKIKLGKFNKQNGYSTKKYTSLYHKIDSNVIAGNTLCFRSVNTDVKIYIDNKLVLDTPYTKHPLSCNSSGSVWYFYEFKPSDIGKTLELKVKPFYNDNSCFITDMYVGNSGQYVYNIFTNNALFFILCFLLTIIGVIFILSDIFINMSQNISTHQLLYIGTYSCALGIWASTSTHLIEFVFDNSQMVQTLACNMLHMLAIPCILFLDLLFNLNQCKSIRILCGYNIVLYIISWILQLTNLADFHKTLKLSHLALCTSLISVIVIIIRHRSNEKTAEKDTLSKAAKYIRNIIFSITVICVFVDAIIYIFGTTTPGLFISFDLVLLLIYLANVSINQLFSSAKAATQAEFIKQLAYKDGLTNVSNRTSYMEKITELENSINSYKSIGIVIFDVNNLKTVNDNLGHIKGDELIISAAKIIEKSFSKFASIYRIGGDEFAAIIEDDNALKLYDSNLDTFIENITEYNNTSNKPYTLSIAYGSAFYDANTKQSLNDIINQADDNMYEKKKEMKNI